MLQHSTSTNAAYTVAYLQQKFHNDLLHVHITQSCFQCFPLKYALNFYALPIYLATLDCAGVDCA